MYERAETLSTSGSGRAGDNVPALWRVGDVILDQYEVRGLLGEGGMGTVHLVHHRGWNMDLAVKSPQPALFASESGKDSFVREAEIWANLGLHPHIVSCHYVRTLGGIPRIFAEYLAGGSLAEGIKSRRLYQGGTQQDLVRLLDLAIQFAWGLEGAHQRGLVHQDVKPANVMFTSEGIAKVTDFGLARARQRAEKSGLSVPSSVPGGVSSQQSILVTSRGMTPAYCSPEQAAGRALSSKTDIWSWAVSVLEMFNGGVTWLSGVAAGAALAAYQASGSDDSSIPPMPSALLELLQRCFQIDPTQRPAHMGEIANELRTIYTHTIGDAYPRSEPAFAEMLADDLNNRALSLLDLGKAAEAEQIWQQALQTGAHLESVYNSTLLHWQRGEIADNQVLSALEQVGNSLPDRAMLTYLQAQVHLARSAVDEALPLLEAITLPDADEPERQRLLNDVRAGQIAATLNLFTLQEGSLTTAVSLNANGSHALVCAGETSTAVQVWDLQNRHLLRTLEGHRAPVTGLQISAHDQVGITCASDGSVRLWDLANGSCLRVLQGHTAPVYCVALNSAGTLALSGGMDQTLRVWDTVSGTCRGVLRSHTDGLSALALSADESKALSGGLDNNVCLWDLSSGTCLQSLQGHTGEITALAFNQAGTAAISASADTTLRFWDLRAGRCLRILRGHTRKICSLGLSADGKRVITGSEDGTMRIWSVDSGRVHYTLLAPTFQARANATGQVQVALSADGQRALVGIPGAGTQVWQIASSYYTPPFRLASLHSHHEVVQIGTRANIWLHEAREAFRAGQMGRSIALLKQIRTLPDYESWPDAKREWAKVARYCVRGSLRSVEAAAIFPKGAYKAVALSADGRQILASQPGRLSLWDFEPGTKRALGEENENNFLAVALTPDGQYALSGGYSGRLMLWETSSGRCLHQLIGHEYSAAQPPTEILTASLSADGRLALTSGLDDALELWDLATERKLRRRTGWGYHDLRAAHMSADGRLGILGERVEKAGKAQIWDIASDRCLHVLEGHNAPVECVHLSSDGRLALTGSTDGEVRLWEVASGQVRQRFSTSSPAHTVCLSVDGRLVLSGHDDGLHIWDPHSGECLRVLNEPGKGQSGHTQGVRAVAMSVDNTRILTCGYEGQVIVWDLEWDLEARPFTDWDDGARPYLETFLVLHTPWAATLPEKKNFHAADPLDLLLRMAEPGWNFHTNQPAPESLSAQQMQQALTRRGKPVWEQKDWLDLLHLLQFTGYGWLTPEGISAHLETIAAQWQGKPPSVIP